MPSFPECSAVPAVYKLPLEAVVSSSKCDSKNKHIRMSGVCHTQQVMLWSIPSITPLLVIMHNINYELFYFVLFHSLATVFLGL